MRTILRNVSVYIAALTLLLCSCVAPMPPYPKGFDSKDPGVRIQTIRMAGDRQDQSVVPQLVNRLEDEDEAVRMFAILALEKITRTRLGYNYTDPEPVRGRAVKRWRAYLQSGGQTATQPAVSGEPMRIP